MKDEFKLGDEVIVIKTYNNATINSIGIIRDLELYPNIGVEFDKKMFILGHSLNGTLKNNSIDGYYVPLDHLKLLETKFVDLNEINDLINSFDE